VTGDGIGVDLARQALAAAREQAKKKRKRHTWQAVRRDGREPLGLGEAIGMMTTEHGLVVPAAGGSVLARWVDILATGRAGARRPAAAAWTLSPGPGYHWSGLRRCRPRTRKPSDRHSTSTLTRAAFQTLWGVRHFG